MKEDEGQVKAVIVRSGDIAHASSVRCFTRQASARVSEDFVERPDTNASRVFFKPGESPRQDEVFATSPLISAKIVTISKIVSTSKLSAISHGIKRELWTFP